MDLKDQFLISAANHYFKVFVALMYPEYIFAKHNRLIINKLQDVAEGKIKRLMINVSPRSGKSLLASQLLPAWFLGKNPEKNVICATYGQELSDTFGRAVRNILKEHKYKAIFENTRLSEDSHKIRKFATSKGGIYRAVGVMGPLTGEGGDLIIIDDPQKSRSEANSPKITTNIIDWFKSTLYTRLSPKGAIVLVQTRWSENDLSGYLLSKEPEKWEVIKIPAIDEENNSYWPERWPVDKLEDIKKSIGSYEFASLYQQTPAPKEGGLFKLHWFKIVQGVPKSGRTVRYWDRAASIPMGHNDPDYTVGIKLLHADGIFYIIDMIRIRDSSYVVQETIKKAAALDGKDCEVCLEQDPGQAGKAEVDYLIRQLAGFNVKSYPVTKSKIVRAGPVAAQAEAGNICLKKADWNSDFLDEVTYFPFGRHDDIIDSLSGAFNALADKKFSYVDFVKM